MSLTNKYNQVNKSIARKVLFVLLLIIIFPLTGLAKSPATSILSVNKEEQFSSQHSTPVNHMLPVNPDLISLISKLKKTDSHRNDIEMSLVQLTLSKTALNAAEQYLLLVAQALLKETFQPPHADNRLRGNNVSGNNVENILAQADKLSSQISEQQLAQPNFIQLHLILAGYFEKQGQYNLAYLEQVAYLKKYHIYRKNKRLAMIASLERSFEVRNKKANNALLKSQNELKVRRVVEVQDEKASQQYNFTLIIATAVVFLLLFFRQLRVRNKLIRLTLTDNLTGLANRSALFVQGKKMVERFAESPEELSVLLLDVDNFKKINDTSGHNIGDKVLMIISTLVKETMRSRDVFARLGGEEFVALLPYADTHKAKAIAMRINEKIAEYDFSQLIIQHQVTISIGIATMPTKQKNKNGISFDELLHCADLAMYQAKAQGRNSVVCYEKIAGSQERRASLESRELDAKWDF